MEVQLDVFQQLIEEDEWVRKQRDMGEEIGFTRGRQKGFAEGEIHALRKALLAIIKRRFPSLLRVGTTES